MHQTLRQQLEHPNQQYHLHLADTYAAQLQGNRGEVIEIDHDMLPATEANMTAARPNTTASDMALQDKTEPTFTAQQNLQIDTPIEGLHQQWDPPLPRSTRGTSTGYARNYCDCRVLATVYSVSDQAKATHCYSSRLMSLSVYMLPCKMLSL
jgi:hypothetical protein